MGTKYTKYKKDIVKKIRKQFPELTVKQINDVIDAYNNQIKEEVNNGHPVTITGMFTLDTKDMEIEKNYHYNLLTEKYDKCSMKYRRITFKSSGKWRDSINKKDYRRLSLWNLLWVKKQERLQGSKQ